MRKEGRVGWTLQSHGSWNTEGWQPTRSLEGYRGVSGFCGMYTCEINAVDMGGELILARGMNAWCTRRCGRRVSASRIDRSGGIGCHLQQVFSGPPWLRCNIAAIEDSCCNGLWDNKRGYEYFEVYKRWAKRQSRNMKCTWMWESLQLGSGEHGLEHFRVWCKCSPCWGPTVLCVGSQLLQSVFEAMQVFFSGLFICLLLLDCEVLAWLFTTLTT